MEDTRQMLRKLIAESADESLLLILVHNFENSLKNRINTATYFNELDPDTLNELEDLISTNLDSLMEQIDEKLGNDANR